MVYAEGDVVDGGGPGQVAANELVPQLAALREDEEAYNLLKDGAKHASKCGARTPLLIALHAGHQDAALLLVQRLKTTRCKIVNSATKQPENLPALMIMVKPSTKEKFAQRRAHPPSDAGLLLQHVTINLDELRA